MLKKCNKCEKLKDISSYYKQKKTKDGYRNYCKECMNKENLERCRKWRLGYGKEYFIKYRADPRNRTQIRCRQLLNNQIESGGVNKRDSCEICHISPSECHHDDYAKPYEFIELCKACHKKLHKQYKDKNITIT